MKFPVTAITLLAAIAFSLNPAKAEGVKDCDAALVNATYSRVESQFIDWRLAELVDEGSYDSIKTEAGVTGAIYGVPVGANYGQFKENIKTNKRSSSKSFTSNTFRNVLWTGLDPSSVTAYSECLKSLAQKNLFLVPRTATSTDISFELKYTVVGNSPNPLPVTWSGIESKDNPLPKEVIAGTTGIIIKRPVADSSLVVNGVGLSDTIVLTPMPAPIPPEELYVSRCEILKSVQPLPQLPSGSNTTWSCPAMLGGDYDIRVAIRPTANGAAFRVLYGLEAVIGSGDKARVQSIYVGNMDINAPGSGLPDVFQGASNANIRDGEIVRVRLYIAGVANHCCFHTTGHNDGTILVPEDVSIVLKRAG
jgi:hypothetical protein